MTRPVQVPASNSDARKRAVRQAHPDPAVRELLARAWDEGWAAGYCLAAGRSTHTPNPYRSES